MRVIACGVLSQRMHTNVVHVQLPKRARRAAAISVLGVLCAFAVAAPSAALAASTVAGALRNADTSALISSGDVGMSLEQRQPDDTYAVVASQIAIAGQYSFPSLDAGEYRLVQTGSSPYGYFPPQQNPGPPFTADGTSDLTVDWPLVRTGVGGGSSTISGEILDERRDTLVTGSSIWVALDQRGPNGSWAHVGDSYTTDGTYVFGWLGTGEYRVRYPASAPDGYERPRPPASPPIVVDGIADTTYDWKLLSVAAVSASSAWSLALLAAAGAGVIAVKSRRVQ